MNTFKKNNGNLLFAAVVALVVNACSSDQQDASSLPATPMAATTSEVPVQMPSALSANVASENNTLPAGWPSDMPSPTGLELLHVLQSPSSSTGKIAIYYGSADKAVVVSQMSSAIESAGYSQISATNHGASISISTWAKGTTKVALNINTAAGHVTCSISVNPVG